jgi:hypothetical protein
VPVAAGGGVDGVWGRSREGFWPEVEALARGGGVGVWGRSKERWHRERDRGREGVIMRETGELVASWALIGMENLGVNMYPPLSLSIFLFFISFLFLFF